MKLLSTVLVVAALFTTFVPVSAAEPTKEFKVSEFTFQRPEKWGWVETTSMMRKAQLKVGEGKDAGEVVFFFFGPGAGGGAKANVERWLGQFKEPREQIKSKVEEATVKGRKISYVQAEGTYLSGMPGGPKTEQPNSMLLGAILPSDDGDVFVKFTGPIETVKKARDDFKKMIEGAVK